MCPLSECQCHYLHPSSTKAMHVGEKKLPPLVKDNKHAMPILRGKQFQFFVAKKLIPYIHCILVFNLYYNP